MSETPNDIYKSQPRTTDHHGRVLICTADKTEDLELFYPYYRLAEEGFAVDICTPNGGAFEGKKGLGLKSSLRIAEVNAGNYDALFIPGGKAPDALRKNTDAVSLVQNFVQAQKPVAAICHGAQLLAASDVIRNRRIAAWPDCEGEVTEAGGQFVNQECVQDGLFVTARWPADLPAFTHGFLQLLNRVTSRTGLPRAA